MRLYFSNLTRPKQAAKYLVRLHPDMPLAKAHEALAQASGYRDWHDLVGATPESAGETRPEITAPDATSIIGHLADALRIPDADVQFAIGKARLCGEALASLDVQLQMRAMLWRSRLFGPPQRGKVGTIVRDRAAHRSGVGYLVTPGRPTRILKDTGYADRADFEVVTPRAPVEDFVPSRLWLPYGYWRLEDGSEVVFSRDYFPMWRIVEDRVERLDPWLWINGKQQETHFTSQTGTIPWASGPARALALEYLLGRRIALLPRLVDVMPHLFETDVESFGEGVWRLHEQRAGSTTAPPEYAHVNERLAWA